MADTTELRNHLKVADSDLDELQTLLADASAALLSHFHGAAAEMREMLRAAGRYPEADASRLHLAMNHLSGAITTLQFQDLACDLVVHAQKRMRLCIDRLDSHPLNGKGRTPGNGLAPPHGLPGYARDTQPGQLA